MLTFVLLLCLLSPTFMELKVVEYNANVWAKHHNEELTPKFEEVGKKFGEFLMSTHTLYVDGQVKHRNEALRELKKASTEFRKASEESLEKAKKVEESILRLEEDLEE